MSKTLPYVFTEQGVAMLATILRTKVAEDSHASEAKFINKLVIKAHERINLLE